MKYAIIGSGKIGTALAGKFARSGIQVAIANTRGPSSVAPLAKRLGSAVVPATLTEALQADWIFLAVPFGSLQSVANATSNWNGKIVVDAMNAFGIPLAILGESPSSALVARALPGAKVVKAFNHLPAAILAGDPPEKDTRRVIFVSSDDPNASAAVAALAEQLGFAPIELGSISASAALLDVRGEKLGALLLQNLVKIGEA